MSAFEAISSLGWRVEELERPRVVVSMVEFALQVSAYN